MTDLLVTTLDDGVATLTLNRPKAINSLNLEMLQAASEILTAWAHDDSVREVVLRGEGARGFSAGADVRELSQAISSDGSWLRFLEVEYLLDLIVAQTLMAMPETKIGFFPDAGVMYWLARAGALGTHMALTSGTIGGGDALRINLADESSDGDLPAPLAEAAWIQECYTGDDPVEIAHRLEEHPDPAAQQAGRELRARSPFAVHVALRALRRAATLDLNGVLHQDLRLAEHMIPVDFVEGVRALLIDKDNQPAWRYATLEDVPTRVVDEVFAY